MDKHVFNAGLEELRLFFPRFKPTSDQRAVWYERLERFDEEIFRLAIFRITETVGTSPSYTKIKEFMFMAKRELGIGFGEEIKIQGGYAPRSDEKWAFQKDGMTNLLAAMEMQDGEARQDRMNMINRAWIEGYKRLPGYINEEAARRVAGSEDLLRYGIIMKKPPEKTRPYYPRQFRAEHSETAVVDTSSGGVIDEMF